MNNEHAVALGKLGGKKTSKRKTEAARRNGRLGGAGKHKKKVKK